MSQSLKSTTRVGDSAVARRVMRLSRRASIMSAIVASLPVHSALPQASSHPKGSLVIVGGGGRGADIMQRFVDLAGGRGQALIAVVPMASEEAAETGSEMVAEFDTLGAPDTWYS